MRATLLIFAALGLAAVCLAIFIATGLVHVSALGPLSEGIGGGGAAPPTQPSPDDPDEADEAGEADAAGPATGPSGEPAFADRSVFLSAADARLSGPKIALFGRENQMIRDAAGDAPPPADRAAGDQGAGGQAAGPEKPGRDGRAGRERLGRERMPRHTFQPFIGRWVDAADSAEWTFVSPAEGAYTVTFVYACPPARGAEADPGAGPYEVSIGGAPLVVRLPRTTKASAFELADAGTLNLPEGEVRLTVHAGRKLNYNDVIHLRSVRLFPVK